MKPEFGDDDLIVENRAWGKKRAEDEKDADEDEEIFAYWCHGCQRQYNEHTLYCDMCNCENEAMYF